MWTTLPRNKEPAAQHGSEGSPGCREKAACDSYCPDARVLGGGAAHVGRPVLSLDFPYPRYPLSVSRGHVVGLDWSAAYWNQGTNGGTGTARSTTQLRIYVQPRLQHRSSH